MNASNIKAAAPHLSSDQVKQLLDWMDVRGGERVASFPDNAVGRDGQIVACMRLGVRVDLPAPAQPRVRGSEERNG